MLTVSDISFKYKGKDALRNISFEVPKASITCLIGPNGSGKTTLLDCIMGIHNNYTGKIMLNNSNVEDMKISKRMQHLSYVPQRKSHTFPFTVREMVIMGRAPHLSFYEQPREDDDDLAIAALNEIGIAAYADRIFTKLSGGEQQLVFLARALVQDTELLILDEPTISLDYYNELRFLEILSRLVKHKNKSIVMATHSPNHAFYFKEQNILVNVLMLKMGKTLGYGEAADILNVKNIQGVYNINAYIVQYDEAKKYIIPESTFEE